MSDPQKTRAAQQEVLQRIERHLQFHPDDVRAVYLGAAALCEVGQRERSLEWAQRALNMEPEDSAVLYNVACAYSLLGETEKAITCLEKAVSRGFGHKEWIESDPDLNSLHYNPRFPALLQQLSARPSKSEPS